MIITLESLQQELAAMFQAPDPNESVLITSMPKCINFPRMVVENWTFPANPEKWAWISIQEVDDKSKGRNIHYPHTTNEFLDKLNSLKLKFHDLEEVIEDNGDTWHPPSWSDAKAIVDFILANKGKSFIINCAAGISRSGAICQFLEECLGYKWGDNKQYALPNKYLFNLLKIEFESRNKTLTGN